MLSVASFYCFRALTGVDSLRIDLLNDFADTDLLGTVLLANEGINASICAGPETIQAFLKKLEQDWGLVPRKVHYSQVAKAPFRRLKINVRRELINLGAPDADPDQRSGEHVNAEKWNELLRDPNVLVIDTRNDYEVGLGTFDQAVNPRTEQFHEFPDYVERELRDKKQTPVAMFCTGGIRCEKASSYLLNMGFEKVYQLDGGILGYLEQAPKESSLWNGECFVFDHRVSVDSDLQSTGRQLCHGCRRPLSDLDLKSGAYEPGICCPACHDDLSETQKNAFAERRRQVALATARGEQHLGADYSRDRATGDLPVPDETAK